MGSSTSNLTCAGCNNSSSVKIKKSASAEYYDYIEGTASIVKNANNSFAYETNENSYEDIGSKKTLSRYDTYFGMPREELVENDVSPATSDRSGWRKNEKVAVSLDVDIDESFFESRKQKNQGVLNQSNDSGTGTEEAAPSSERRRRRGKRDKTIEKKFQAVPLKVSNSENSLLEKENNYFDL